MRKQTKLSVLLLAIFAVGILSAAVPVKASISGTVAIERPDKIVPGGAIELYMTGFESTGGTVYFLLSLNNEGEISSGDIVIDSWKRADVTDEVGVAGYITIYLPTTGIPADEYYVKVSDSKSVGYTGIIVTDDKVEVIPEEDWPTITVDPESGKVGKEIDVDGEDIDTTYKTADLFWDTYEDDASGVLGAPDYRGTLVLGLTVDGDFTHTMDVPEAYMDGHKIIVLLSTAALETLGTFADFDVEPSIEVGLGLVSVLADAEGQVATLYSHGFPEGDIDSDTITYAVKDILTGGAIQTRKTYHAGIDIEKRVPGPPGTFGVDAFGAPIGLDVTAHYVKQGVIDVKFTVNGKAFTLEDALLSSKPRAIGEFDAKMDKTSGKIGDKVTFSAIGLPAIVDVDVILDNEVDVVTRSLQELPPGGLGLILPDADANGAWKYAFTLTDLPGGTFRVKVKDVTNAAPLTIGDFEILPDVTFYDSGTLAKITKTLVDNSIYIEGDGFRRGAELDTILVAGEDFEIDPPITIDTDGLFASPDFVVPHVSGGGKKVPVEIKGVDRKDKSYIIESEITIDPDVPVQEYLEWNPATGANEWTSLGGTSIFAGNPMRIDGTGFIAGESVTITFSSDLLDVTAKAKITDGGTADSDGDLEAVFSVPVSEDFAITVPDWEIKIAGATATNKFTIEGVAVSSPNDAEAKLFFGLKADGDLDLTVYVGDIVRVVGVGFSTKTITLSFGGKEVKDVSVVEDAGVPTGFFDTTVTIPELERAILPDHYHLDSDVAGANPSDEVELKSAVTLSPAKAVSGATVTASGTGWLDDEKVDIKWTGLPALATDIDPSSKGSWEETFTVPDTEAGTYTITFIDDDGYEVEKSFFVLGPLKIVSLSLPTSVYNGSKVTISVNVRDYFDAAVSAAAVTGKITTADGRLVPLTFTETAAGIYDATYNVPADAAEGTYKVDVEASKPEAGGTATASGTFYVELKLPPTPPPPPVDISELEASVTKLSGDLSGLKDDVSDLSGDVSKLSGDVSGLKSDIAGLKSYIDEAIAAIPVVPIEWIYITAIMAIIAAIAAIAAVVAVYRKIA